MRRTIAMCCAIFFVGCNNESPPVAAKSTPAAPVVQPQSSPKQSNGVASIPADEKPKTNVDQLSIQPLKTVELNPVERNAEAKVDLPAPEPPKESPKARAFKEKLANFLEEARAGAKLLKLTPTPTYQKVADKVSQLEDLYTHIPDVPKELDATGEIAKKLEAIHGLFAAAEFAAEQRVRLLKARLRNEAEGNEAQCKEFADRVEKLAAEIESIINERKK